MLVYGANGVSCVRYFPAELPIGRAAVVSEPAAIRRVLLANCDSSEKDSASLIGGLLTVEGHTWRTPHSKTI